MKENFQVTDKDTGKTYWISRAHCVVGVIMFKITKNGQWYFLLEKRGPGCPDNIGKWCVVCGYLNWGETRKEAVIRECYEETGYKPNPNEVIELQVIDDPKRDDRENISTRYAIIADANLISSEIDLGDINVNTELRGGESNEVSEIKMFSLSAIERMNSDEFAFNHKELILEIVDLVDNKLL